MRAKGADGMVDIVDRVLSYRGYGTEILFEDRLCSRAVRLRKPREGPYFIDVLRDMFYYAGYDNRGRKTMGHARLIQ